MNRTYKPANECPICRNLRPLSDHLYELGEFCIFLGNTVVYEEDDLKREIHTTVIGDWIKLASQLEKVEINTWKYADDSASLYCSTVADQYDSDSKHFSNYSTYLTKFIFICNSLEEIYRFVSSKYDILVKQKNSGLKSGWRKPNMKAAALIDTIAKQQMPENFEHLSDNFISIFAYYQKKYKPQLSGMRGVSKNKTSYALHLVRNLRNHVAHGVFPIVYNPEYYIGEDAPILHLMGLLQHACRISAVYMQALLFKFNAGFQSYEYSNIENAHGEEFDYFIKNCTIGYLGSLHVNGEFSFATAFN